LVTYSLSTGDTNRLNEGLHKLARLLFAAGAERLFPSITGCPSIEQKSVTSTGPAALFINQDPPKSTQITKTLTGIAPLTTNLLTGILQVMGSDEKRGNPFLFPSRNGRSPHTSGILG